MDFSEQSTSYSISYALKNEKVLNKKWYYAEKMRRLRAKNIPVLFTKQKQLKFIPFIFSIIFFFNLITTALPQSIPLVSECRKDSVSIFLLQHNTTNGQLLRTVPATNFLDCSEICSNANVNFQNSNRDNDIFINKSINFLKNSKNAYKNKIENSPLIKNYTSKINQDLVNIKFNKFYKKDFVKSFENNNTNNNELNKKKTDCDILREFDANIQHDLQDCVGVEYADGQCRIIGESKTKYSKLQNQFSSHPIVTKSCVKSERVCSSPFHFDVHEQKILVGFAREVVPADSIEICLSACLNAFDTFGFECESVMYYPVDAECILNTEDRLDRPDLFIDEHEDKVIYLDNNCAESQCYAPYVTQYIAVEGKQLSEELDHVFTDLDQSSCEELCSQRLTTTINDFNCKSYMYNNKTRTCILSDERSKPLGRGNLTNAVDYIYYEKKCFASPRTCRNIPSFTRVSQKLLVGFAAFVMENVPSVTMCLDQCTNPPPETGDKFVCKSAMYYYNEQECILNAESRHTKPDLFIKEEDDFVVDYFDINCRLEAEVCPNDKKLHTIKTLNSALPEGDGSLHVIETFGNSVADCTTKCFTAAPEKCRSFNYDKILNTCNLLYLDGKTTLRPQPKKNVDFYDLHCLQGPTSMSSCLNGNGTLFSRYLYTKIPGLPTKEYPVVALSKCLDICSTSERCEGVNYNRRNGNCAIFFKIDIQPGAAIGEKHDHIDFYTNLCLVKEIDSGLSSAVNVPKKKVVVKSENLGNHQDLLIQSKKPQIIREQEARRKPNSEKNTLSGISKSFGSKQKQHEMPVPIPISPGSVQTFCNYEGISVQIKNNKPFTGVVFVKNKYETCRVEVVKSNSATLVLGLPQDFGMKPMSLQSLTDNAQLKSENEEKNVLSNLNGNINEDLNKNEIRRIRRETQRDCGIIDMDNGTYKTTVVVQTNNLGIPGLVTSMDQIFEVSCNYSSMLGGKVKASSNMKVNGPQATLIQPKGKIELGNPVLMQMFGNGSHSAVQAKLGDILELRWEIVVLDEELDFFVKDCFAEPDLGSGAVNEKLKLIEDGCPTPAVAQKLIPKPIQVQSSSVKIAYLQAFRFDSSSKIRLTCELEICKKSCQAVTCSLLSGQKQSWGRKKRSINEKENLITSELVTKRYKVPRFAKATTSLVIIDPFQQISEPQAQAAVSLAKQSVQEFSQVGPKYDILSEENFLKKVGTEKLVTQVKKDKLYDTSKKVIHSKMCMNKWTLFGVFGTLFVLIIVQALIVTKFIFKRVFFNNVQTLNKKKNDWDVKSFHY